LFSSCSIKVDWIVIFIINFIEEVMHLIFYFYIFKYNIWLLKKISLKKLFVFLKKYLNLIYFIKFLFVFIIFMIISITCLTAAKAAFINKQEVITLVFMLTSSAIFLDVIIIFVLELTSISFVSIITCRVILYSSLLIDLILCLLWFSQINFS
jgi:hypothetical protein